MTRKHNAKANHNVKHTNPLMDVLIKELHNYSVISWESVTDYIRCDLCENRAVIEVVGTLLCRTHETEVRERMK
jgi:hypothetical protein